VTFYWFPKTKYFWGILRDIVAVEKVKGNLERGDTILIYRAVTDRGK